MTTTLTVTKVKELAKLPNERFGDLEHLIKVSQLMSRVPTDPNLSVHQLKVVKQLVGEGFPFFVDKELVLSIPYVAEVWPCRGYRQEGVYVAHKHWYGNEESNLAFVGDIPDRIITRVEPLKGRAFDRSGLEMITVHSFMPLPIEFIRACPVMVGWVSAPRIVCNAETLRVLSCDDCLGAVVGMWDAEREVEMMSGELLRDTK